MATYDCPRAMTSDPFIPTRALNDRARRCTWRRGTGAGRRPRRCRRTRTAHHDGTPPARGGRTARGWWNGRRSEPVRFAAGRARRVHVDDAVALRGAQAVAARVGHGDTPALEDPRGRFTRL